MLDKETVLDEIFASDVGGILNTKPRTTPAQNEDQRLVSTFEEINAFIDEHGKEPTRNMTDMHEAKLFSRLKGLREQEEKKQQLQEHDRHGLLEVEEELEINSLDDIFGGDDFGLLEDEEDIFTLKHVQKTIDTPEYRAKQKPCKDFDKYEHKFKECHQDLVNGKRELLPYANEQYLDEGSFFILKGVMVYIAHKGKKEKVKGKVNARLHCIYENGTESDLLLRSLSRELYRNGKRITEHEDRVLNKLGGITDKDTSTGYIYILRSESQEDRIKFMKNLFKIGFSTIDVKERIKNAKNEPTYLMAPVSIVSVYETYNMNTHRFEQLLHQFFGHACLDFAIEGTDGQTHRPREWFIAPLEVIEQSIKLIISGEVVNYQYDMETEMIVKR